MKTFKDYINEAKVDPIFKAFNNLVQQLDAFNNEITRVSNK